MSLEEKIPLWPAAAGDVEPAGFAHRLRRGGRAWDGEIRSTGETATFLANGKKSSFLDGGHQL